MKLVSQLISPDWNLRYINSTCYNCNLRRVDYHFDLKIQTVLRKNTKINSEKWKQVEKEKKRKEIRKIAIKQWKKMQQLRKPRSVFDHLDDKDENKDIDSDADDSRFKVEFNQ